MDKDFFLFDANREKLKRIFLKLSKNDKRLNFIDFQRLCLSGKLIPNFISQNQLRALAGKFGNAAVLTKLFLSFEQFEQYLKIISVSKSQPPSRPEKIVLFFQTLSQGLRMQFEGTDPEPSAIINRSNSSYSINSELNESNSSLDLSIKEALNTLKSETKKPVVASARVALSPRPIGRAYSNPSTPKSRSYKGFGNEMTSKIRVSLVSPSNSARGLNRPRNKLELDEFLETEKLVQREVNNVKVTMRPDYSKKVEPRSYPRVFDSGYGKLKTSARPSHTNVMTREKVLEKTIAGLTGFVGKHKRFIERVQSRRVTKRFICKLVLKNWALETIRMRVKVSQEVQVDSVEEVNL